MSPRVAPGLLTRAAWQAVATADRVGAEDRATVEALLAAGVPVEHVDVEESILQAEGEVRVAVLVDADTARSVRERVPGCEVLEASYDVPGARLLDLVGVMDRLRIECPWDREQTHRSLVRYLVEESYETLEAIETGDLGHLREELGDLLLQVFFHARIASEGSDGFDIDDVARGITDKLVYRHPHVFAGLAVEDADEVDRNWEALKAAEKGRASPLDGVPVALPALSYADKVLGRLARAGVTAPAAQATGTNDVGERLLALVRTARAAGLDPEQELRGAVRRLIARASLDGRSPGAV